MYPEDGTETLVSSYQTTRNHVPEIISNFRGPFRRNLKCSNEQKRRKIYMSDNN